MTYIQRRAQMRGFGDDSLPGLSTDPIPSFPSPGDPTDNPFGTQGSPSDASEEAQAVADANATPYVVFNGVCKPTSQAVLDQTKELQRQVNRALVGLAGGKSSGTGLVGVDGDLGNQTLTALSKLAASGVVSAGLLGSCGTVGFAVPGLTLACKAFADGKGVSGSVSSPAPSVTPSFVNTKTNTVVAQGMASSVIDGFKRMSTIEQVSVMAAAGGVALLAFTGKKMKRRSKR